MVDFFRYHKKFVSYWTHEMWRFGREQVIGIILAVLILAFQMWKGLIPARDASMIAKATVLWPYLVLVGVYFVFHLVRTPWKLDQKLIAQLEYQASEKEIKSQIGLLTQLADRGQEFIRRCRSDKELVSDNEVALWLGYVMATVEKIFDETYISRLESSVGMPLSAAYWPNIENRHIDGLVNVRVYRLQEFIDELRWRLKGARQ
jgi:hypothetical protein